MQGPTTAAGVPRWHHFYLTVSTSEPMDAQLKQYYEKQSQLSVSLGQTNIRIY